MDETNQQQPGSDAVPKDFDCDTALKGTADEKIAQESPRKSSCDAPSSDALIEALNTNGIDKECESQTSNDFSKGDLESPQSQENAIQGGNTSNDNIINESDVGLSADSEKFSDRLVKCDDKADNEINSGGGEEKYSNVGDSIKSDVSEDRKNNEGGDFDVVKTVNALDSVLNRSPESDKECTTGDLSEKSELCESLRPTETNQVVNLKEKTQEDSSKREVSNSIVDKSSENEISSSQEELVIKKDKEDLQDEVKNNSETVTPLEVLDAAEAIRPEEGADNSLKLDESDIDISGDKSETSSSQITQIVNQQKEEKEVDEKETLLRTSLDEEEENCPEDHTEKPKDDSCPENLMETPKYESKADESCPEDHMEKPKAESKEDLTCPEDHMEKPKDETKEDVTCPEDHMEKPKDETKEDVTCPEDIAEKSKDESKEDENCSEDLAEIPKEESNEGSIELKAVIQSKVLDSSTGESESELGNEKKDLVSAELQSELGSKLADISSSELQPEIENQDSELNESMSEVVPMEVNLSSEVTNPQEEEEEDKKREEADECESSQKHVETPFDESEKENLDLGDKNRVGEFSQTNRLSTSGEQEEEEESTNKSETEGNEVMDTEMVNCNEIEQIDLSESENDLKGEGRDDEMVSDSLETGEKTSEDQMSDGREGEKSAMLIDEEGTNQPGSSEEETITGDTTNQSSTDLSKDKDEEICIIPDDVIPVLSMLPHSKDVGTREGENGSVTVLKVTPSESVKPKTRAQDRRSQGSDSKSRPVRNAAKLAGNKIKSLVESDLVFDDQAMSGDLEVGNVFQENTDESAQMCAQCREVKVCKLLSVQNDITQYLCSEQCSSAFKAAQMDAEPTESDSTLREYARKCGQCHSQITLEENRLFWETLDFCNEDCLGKYQLEIGSNCSNCKKSVPSVSLGKYCVRFGYDIRQFCSALCLEEYKKGLKVCSCCQKDISTGAEGFLAPVGSKGQFKDFCTQSCMEKYDRMSSNKPLPEIIEECAVCSNSKPVQVEVELDNKTHKLCSEPCFAAFKFVNNITEGQCDMCRKYFDRAKIPNYSLRLLFYDETLHSFCSKTCMNVYILANRKIVPCNWCKVKKYNFDMIKKVCSDGQLSMMCSLNCLMLYQTSVNAVCSRPIRCDFCKKKFVRQPLYHLTMSDATLRNFCSYNCVMSFQSGYPKKIDVVSGPDQLGPPMPTGGPKRIAPKRAQVEPTCVPVISSVQSLASPNGPASPTGRVQIPRGDVGIVSQPLSVPASPVPAPPPQIYQQIITKPAPAKQMKNKSVLCKPYSHTKGVSCRPHPCMKETQTDQSLNRKFLIPIPVPIYVPAPMHMFATPFPVPVPFPLPVPVPIFIPTTRNSAKGIMKEIKKIQEKIPTDPFEAELLMMAEMVAGDKKQDPTDSESEDGNDGDDNGDGTFSPENVDTSNTFGDDMLQMALKMASELEEPAVDMESVLTSNTITTSTQPAVDPSKGLYASDTDDPDQVNVMAMNRGRKRSVRGSRTSTGGTPSKRGRRTSGSVEVPLLPPPEPVPPRTIEVEKPDANMCLKYTFGVNAWRHWVMQKNAELEKAALTNRKIKLFKPELLQLTADELNFSLCLFVKEVRKPNGTEYAPDTIYYLCLGIQQYLFENGRIDNIFTDSYYEKFTDCLDEVAKKFAALYNDSQYIVTRVEEEHLWESKQLGAHSPHVLLSTLMFFNTKHFNLVTVEEHMQLSFSHIMKHWKRNPNTPGVAKVPGSRNVLLRFYPPQSALEANSRKKKVYEQQENEENPLRCPVKLYEFYLSKCPESVKTRNDVFYLLPERSCVPDSPVWYSTMALGKEPLMKMLHRIKMVKEINIALLTS